MYSIETPEISAEQYAQFYTWFAVRIGTEIDLDAPTPFSRQATILDVTESEGISICNWFEHNTGHIISF